MGPDALNKSIKYLELVQSKLADIPTKHKDRQKTYLEFWNKELAVTLKKVEALKLAAPSKKSY
jgi:hypothetical protein